MGDRWLCVFLLVDGGLSGVLREHPELPQIRSDEPRGPFRPRDIYPTAPNVERLIGPEDCRGSTLAAVRADLPNYPASAYRNGRQGPTSIPMAVCTVPGSRSVPDAVFDRAAMSAVSDWEFRPLDGADILENCVVMFEFALATFASASRVNHSIILSTGSCSVGCKIQRFESRH